MSEMEKLADCPFCGANAQRANELSHDDHAIECISCFATTGLCETAEDAVIRWNTRQHATALEIGRGIGREEAARMFEREAAKWREIADMLESEARTDALSRISCLESALADEERAKRIRAASPALDVEGMVEIGAKTLYVAESSGTGQTPWLEIPDTYREMMRRKARAVLASLGIKNG